MTNTGDRRGVAVPQLYLALPSHPGVPEPPKVLKGFKRVALAPGRTRRVRFPLSRRALSYWDVHRDRWRLVRGCARVLVGRSSARTRLRAAIPGQRGCARG